MEALAIIISMIVMFLWLRTEANADRRESRTIQSEDRKDIMNLVRAIQEDVKAIQSEMKDFHDRLCTIEQKKK